jgi:hypothetical protein
VAGYAPSAADREEEATALLHSAIAEAPYPNVRRWLRNMGSFSAKEKAAWQ